MHPSNKSILYPSTPNTLLPVSWQLKSVSSISGLSRHSWLHRSSETPESLPPTIWSQESTMMLRPAPTNPAPSTLRVARRPRGASGRAWADTMTMWKSPCLSPKSTVCPPSGGRRSSPFSTLLLTWSWRPWSSPSCTRESHRKRPARLFLISFLTTSTGCSGPLRWQRSTACCWWPSGWSSSFSLNTSKKLLTHFLLPFFYFFYFATILHRKPNLHILFNQDPDGELRGKCNLHILFVSAFEIQTQVKTPKNDIKLYTRTKS